MFDLLKYRSLLAVVESATTNKQKGDSFESLFEYLIGCLEGVIIEARDVNLISEELDLIVWNTQTEEVLKPFESVFIIECKNWSGPADAKELDNFISKLIRRDLKTGIFVAANGVTGDFINGKDGSGAVDIIKSSLGRGIRVIIINKQDLDSITTIDQFRVLIRKRYCGLFTNKLFNN